jgi:hypothetical protein
MKVKLHQVHVPSKSSRTFTVPAYDIPIIRALWPQALLIPGQHIEVQGLGMTEWRDQSAEWDRLQRDYSSQVDGVPAYKAVYATREQFLEAFRRAAGEGEQFDAEVERVRADAAAMAAPEAPASRPAPAAPADDFDNLEDEDQAAKPARRRH